MCYIKKQLHILPRGQLLLEVEMLFNSYEFIFLFLPIAILGFFGIARWSHRAATAWLVVASLFFYGWWDWHYVPLLMSSIVWNYFIGCRLERQPGRRGWLILGITVNLALLGYFKYTDFFLGTVNALAGADVFSLPHIVLPLGISFFTFTQTAYIIDAYRGETVGDSFLTYCEFVTIFPHLIAGPIINHKDMMPQFTAERTFRLDYSNLSMGLTLFAMGLFKKVVIADWLSPIVGDVFTHADSVSLIEAWIGALGYTLQLYFDFSGYSEMAIGLGLMLNLRFPVNFDSPYRSTSIIEFWRRWHMTLGSWVKYYLYIPLGGNRHGEWKKMRNLFVSMLIIGLWHGAGWTFILWGALHGVALMINHQWRRLQLAMPKTLAWTLTFLVVMVCWVFFRAENFHVAIAILSAMTDIHNLALPAGTSLEHHLGFLQAYGITFIGYCIKQQFHQCLIVIGILLMAVLFAPNPIRLAERHFQTNWRWLIASSALILYAIYKMNTYTEFLYFQF